MSSSTAKIHVLDLEDYSNHRLVTLNDESKPSLAPSSLRFRPRILGQTTNNLTYARLGAFMGWYDIYPLPESTPTPYNDSTKYGRVSAWGYSEIIESTVPGISAGQTLFGYFPPGTNTEDVRVEFAEHNGKKFDDQIYVLNEHRQHLWKVYNRLQLLPPLAELEKSQGLESLGFDALMQVLFGTSYNMNKFGFGWTDETRIHPGGDAKGEWTAEDADLRDAAVVILNASGKTGISFAYCLRECRPKEQQPKSVIGVGSEKSVKFIADSGFFDKASLNADAQSVAVEIEKSGARRVVLLDFGARSGAPDQWTVALKATSVPFEFIAVGGEVEPQNKEKTAARFASFMSITIVNANDLREKGFNYGGPQYLKEFHAEFEGFKKKQKLMSLKWENGFEQWENGWEAFCKDQVPASTGMVYCI